MDIITARRFLKELAFNYNPKNSCKSQINALYVHCIWNPGTLLRRDSFLGKISHALYYTREYTAEARQTQAVFKRIIQTYRTEDPRLTQIRPDLGCRLSDEFPVEDSPPADEQNTLKGLDAHPELDELIKLQSETLAEARRKSLEKSLLREKVTATSPPLETSVLKALLYGVSEISAPWLKYFEEYLGIHPHLKNSAFDTHLDLVKESLKQKKRNRFKAF